MNKEKIVCALLILMFILSLVLTIPVNASTADDKGQQVFSYLASEEDKPQNKPGKPSSATVNLQNIPSGDYLLGTVTIIAQASGSTVANVFYSIDSGPDNEMLQVRTTGRYQAQWDTSGSTGQHTITIKAKDSADLVVATSTIVTVTIVSAPKYELRYEIDCMAGYTPSTGVFSYLTGYWLQHAIKVSFRGPPR